MHTYFETRHIKQLAKINYVLLASFLAISVTSHVIAYRLVSIEDIPLIPSSFVYMAAFVITDVFACFNSRKFVIFIILLEALVNLFFIIITNIVIRLPAPAILHDTSAYANVFTPVFTLYISNLIGTFIAFLIDLFIFYFLYKKQQWNFLSASLLSSLLAICFYTFLTDLLAFFHLYPYLVWKLASINLLTNVLSLLLYSLLGQLVVIWIKNKLNGKYQIIGENV